MQQLDKIAGLLGELRPEADFRSSDDFFRDGLLDSFELVALVSSLDERYRISIDGTDIIPENFKSLHAIASLLDRYLGTP